jgi:protein-disulfide isomerase
VTRKESFDRIVSALVLLLAMASFSLIVVRFFREPGKQQSELAKSVKQIDDWETKSRTVVRPVTENSSGRVVVTVFTDFECPFCRRMDSLLVDYQQKNPGLINLQVVHLPLPMHAHSKPASHAFECALQQGRSESFASALYRHQDKFGSIAWDSLAAIAGVSSIDTFRSCMLGAIPREVAAGERLASEMSITVTPTILLNDWLISPADPDFVFRSIKAVVDGKKPKP